MSSRSGSSSVEVAVRDLRYMHDSASAPLLEGLTAPFPRGFTGVVGANGTGKTTLLRLLAGDLEPDGGQRVVPDAVAFCPQRTDAAPPAYPAFLDAEDPDAWVLRGRLGVEVLRDRPWSTLSHGERKRAQIGTALWQTPDLLLVDEPTNHIDAEARALLLDALRTFRGVGVIVSHDRDLLDALCAHCLWLEPPGAALYPGGYSEARAQREAAHEAALREHADARRERDRLEREQRRRREAASHSHRLRSKRGLAPKDSDGRARRDLARVTGKDGQAGRIMNQLAGRTAQAGERLARARVRKEHLGEVWLAGTAARRDALLDRAAGSLPLLDGRGLVHPPLRIGSRDRIALTGPNGAGKSTLVASLLPELRVDAGRLLYLPQEVSAAGTRALLDAVRALPGERLGHVMQIVARLGSAPGRLLETREPSPGEARKLQFALGVTGAPQLVVMDEPTNHLDLPAIEALESALADCPCALLLVSHDARFLAALAEVRWALEADADGSTRLRVER